MDQGTTSSSGYRSGTSGSNRPTRQPQVSFVDETGVDDDQWATPAEVLEFKAMWREAQAEYQRQLQHLTEKLSQMTQERDSLFAEVRETGKLRTLYEKAKTSYNEVAAERAHWEEERETLYLKMQRMSNEIERLRLSRGGASVSSGSGASAVAGSYALGSSWQSVCREQDIEQLEELQRRTLEVSILEQRCEFLAVMQGIEQERHLRQLFEAAGQQDALKGKLRFSQEAEENLRRSLRFAQEECRTLRSKVEELDGKLLDTQQAKRADALAIEQQWDSSWREDVAAKEATWRRQEDHLREELRDAVLLREQSEGREKELSRRAALAEDDLMRLEATAAEEKKQLADQLAALNTAFQDHKRFHERQLALLRDENQVLQQARTHLDVEVSQWISKHAAASRQALEAQAQAEQQGVELERLSQRVQVLTNEVNESRNIATERDSYRIRATGLEEELHVQREFYEKQLGITQSAAAAGRQHDENFKNELLVELAKVRRAHQELLDRNREAAARREERQRLKDRQHGQLMHEMQKLNHQAAPTKAAQVSLDPLTILKNTMIAANKLQASVQKSS